MTAKLNPLLAALLLLPGLTACGQKGDLYLPKPAPPPANPPTRESAEPASSGESLEILDTPPANPDDSLIEGTL